MIGIKNLINDSYIIYNIIKTVKFPVFNYVKVYIIVHRALFKAKSVIRQEIAMKITTRVYISTLLLIGFAVTVGLSLFHTTQQLKDKIGSIHHIEGILRGIDELHITTNDYLQYHGERARFQWQSKHDSFT
ncbi:hypothetical protein LCGC14_1266720 [marine sediment metagenome]|uniref:Uncharacterized protein n=1 Tax=marine sediment metagenome TaxID=412755 RepID=A0A0F9LKB0_9ZZZZ